MKIIILILSFAPTLIEAYLDRFGESKKSKKKDTLWMLIAAAGIIGLSWWVMDVPPLLTGIPLLVWRLCTFDYLVNWFLKRYSPGHSDINVFSFTGTTAYFDKLTAKIPPVIRLISRGIVFAASLAYFLLS